jgi:AraC-like DNA-binding protein
MEAHLSTVPKLYIWLNRTLYLGTMYVPLRKYTVAADQLVVCLSGEIILDLDEGHQESCRTILLRAGTTVDTSKLDARSAIIAICYLDPLGQDYAALRTAMLEHEGDSSAHHRDEEQVIETLRHIRDAHLPSAQAAALVENLIFPPELDRQKLPVCDPRIVKVIQLIKQTVRENIPVSDLAEAVHLSESRLVKLFRREMGIPITKYRLRYRLLVGVVYLAMNRSVTEAALAAGFASTAHFSKCHTATFGTPPSTAFLTPPFLDISLAEEVQRAVAERCAADEAIGGLSGEAV